MVLLLRFPLGLKYASVDLLLGEIPVLEAFHGLHRDLPNANRWSQLGGRPPAAPSTSAYSCHVGSAMRRFKTLIDIPRQAGGPVGGRLVVIWFPTTQITPWIPLKGQFGVI